ncbi:MAG: efflux RND transporter periplasmic adaptor subunit [Acidobacteriota bacterium]|nr:MAG: efflux RND transporter periplasmic adaptor subunit [Acidobacteriota bacterium]
MRGKFGAIILITAAVIAAIAGAACGAGGKSENANTAAAAPTTVPVETTQAVVRQIPKYFEATGNLASDAATDVAPAIGGKIVEVNFDVGSYVEKGSVLVRLDDRDARIRVEQAEAQVEQQKKAVNQAVAALRQAQIRLGVRDGETFDIEKFSQVISTRANLELAEKELARAERLYATEDISRSLLDQRRAQRDALVGQLAEARSNAAVAVKAITAAETAVVSARAAVNTAQTQVDQAKKALSDTVITAPISGYISERIADPGEFVTPNAPNTKVATIVRTGTLRLRIDVPEQSIGSVKIGQSISMQTSAYPDRNFAGRVVRMLPTLNAQARSLTVEAEVPNTDGLLKPGQFAIVRITQAEPENAVMVPVAAVKTEGDVNKVFVIRDGAAREQLVQLGLLEDRMIQIKSGVAEGDIVAVSNLDSLFDGVFVAQ